MELTRKKILVLLSEAQEEDTVVIVNTLIDSDFTQGRMSDIVGMIAEFISLQYCVLSKDRDPTSLRAIELSPAESMDEIKKAQEFIGLLPPTHAI
jgi:hypothetical protein